MRWNIYYHVNKNFYLYHGYLPNIKNYEQVGSIDIPVNDVYDDDYNYLDRIMESDIRFDGRKIWFGDIAEHNGKHYIFDISGPRMAMRMNGL